MGCYGIDLFVFCRSSNPNIFPVIFSGIISHRRCYCIWLLGHTNLFANAIAIKHSIYTFVCSYVTTVLCEQTTLRMRVATSVYFGLYLQICHGMDSRRDIPGQGYDDLALSLQTRVEATRPISQMLCEVRKVGRPTLKQLAFTSFPSPEFVSGIVLIASRITSNQYPYTGKHLHNAICSARVYSSPSLQHSCQRMFPTFDTTPPEGKKAGTCMYVCTVNVVRPQLAKPHWFSLWYVCIAIQETNPSVQIPDVICKSQCCCSRVK